MQQTIAPVQHDSINYGPSFAHRGNLTLTTRWDTTQPANAAAAITTASLKYNTAGSVVARITPWDGTNTRTVRIGYADSWNSTGNPSTYAYPTTITDPAGFSSSVTYRYDFGANVEANSPPPAGQTYGKRTKRTFDDKGRLSKDAVWLWVQQGSQWRENFYTRYEYPANGVQLKVYSTILDANASGHADAADEVLGESWFDGAGRVRMSRSPHPGSTGGFSGTLVEYDALGRVRRRSAPTEIPGSWTFPANTLWTSFEYDWMGRATKTINTDGTFSTASYDGCGCAGGQVVTAEGEQLPDGKRKQKVYSDILGRPYKTETFNWDGTTYSSTVTSYDGGDRALRVKQYAGAAPSGAVAADACPLQPAGEPQSCQLTSLSYDGHGRLSAQHTPQQDEGSSTQFAYGPDDRVVQTTDARGATASYAYNSRGLVASVSHLMPVQPEPPDSFVTGNSPIGHLDYVDNNGWKVKGWTFDPNTPSTSIDVHIYIDGPAGNNGQYYVGQTTANVPRPDVNAAYGITGNHGFEFTIPNQYLDGGQHTVYAYGIDAGTDPNKLLIGSPKTFSYNHWNVQPPLETTVTFQYDAAGNRTSATDALGSTSYEYDSLSRLKAETRNFVDTTANGTPLAMQYAPLPNNGFRLQYTYGPAGQLKSLTDPFGAVVDYGYDAAGRLANVTGSSFGGRHRLRSGRQIRGLGRSQGARLRQRLECGDDVQRSAAARHVRARPKQRQRGDR